ncbi:hypothetical protein ACTXT7_006112 [Hymenolepis weldensis]
MDGPPTPKSACYINWNTPFGSKNKENVARIQLPHGDVQNHSIRPCYPLPFYNRLVAIEAHCIYVLTRVLAQQLILRSPNIMHCWQKCTAIADETQERMYYGNIA